jgi:hypothetical protein
LDAAEEYISEQYDKRKEFYLQARDQKTWSARTELTHGWLCRSYSDMQGVFAS